MPQISWDVSATSYPYQLNLMVDEDLNGIKTKEINTQILKRLASGIGYDYSKDIHGGDCVAFRGRGIGDGDSKRGARVITMRLLINVSQNYNGVAIHAFDH
jgi:hypothetical protein